MDSESPSKPSIWQWLLQFRQRLHGERSRLHLDRPHLGVLGLAEDFVHYVVAIVLLAVALIVLYHTAYDLATTDQPFAAAATAAVNGVLFAIIVLEVMRTVVAQGEPCPHGQDLPHRADDPDKAPNTNRPPRSSRMGCWSSASMRRSYSGSRLRWF
jgi:hypothetical protein